jgi:signal transduction histidine kinase
VLNISQIEKELPPNTLVRLNLQEVISEILNTLKLQFEKLNVKVNFNCKGEDFIILGDRQHFDGLLYNLLDNAMKYNSNPNPEINIQLTHENDKINIKIADNGMGIAQEHQKNVFEKFYRVPQGNVHNIKGHGLGLSYVAQVVQEMGGIIELESRESIGSVFTILIPKNSNN